MLRHLCQHKSARKQWAIFAKSARKQRKRGNETSRALNSSGSIREHYNSSSRGCNKPYWRALIRSKRDCIIAREPLAIWAQKREKLTGSRCAAVRPKRSSGTRGGKKRLDRGNAPTTSASCGSEAFLRFFLSLRKA